ncbi:TIM barrel protein [Coprothermobacteraceae bacterium]|nr:TIM barrel protein [Coprothermobacteraceae bacterium]
MLHIGLHLSLQDGVDGILKQIEELELDSFQIFLESPLTWTTKRDLFRFQSMIERARSDFGVSTVFIHAPYLVHLGSKTSAVRAKSWHRVREDLLAAQDLAVDGYIVHFDLQSPSEVERFKDEYNRTLATLTSHVPLLLENIATSNSIGSNPRYIAGIVESISAMYPASLCIDTAHLAAAGYDIVKFVQHATWERLSDKISLVHLNDLKTPTGSSRDVHAHLGKGSIGHGKLKAFVNALADGTSVILETPKDTPDDDRQNVTTLRRMLS